MKLRSLLMQTSAEATLLGDTSEELARQEAEHAEQMEAQKRLHERQKRARRVVLGAALVGPMAAQEKGGGSMEALRSNLRGFC